VVDGRQDRAAALRRYAGFSAAHRWKFEAMLRWQDALPRIPPRVLAGMLGAMQRNRRLTAWAFDRYLGIAHPDLAGPVPIAAPAPAPEAVPA
jgi:hypothetical protein